MQVKRIADCKSMLHYFRPSFNYHPSFCLFLISRTVYQGEWGYGKSFKWLGIMGIIVYYQV